MNTEHRPFLAPDKPLLHCSCGDMNLTSAEFKQHRKEATAAEEHESRP